MPIQISTYCVLKLLFGTGPPKKAMGKAPGLPGTFSGVVGGRKCSLVVQSLPSMNKAPSSIPSTIKKNRLKLKSPSSTEETKTDSQGLEHRV